MSENQPTEYYQIERKRLDELLDNYFKEINKQCVGKHRGLKCDCQANKRGFYEAIERLKDPSRLLTLEGEKEAKRISNVLKILQASMNGALDGLELDNTDDVIEKSVVIEQIKDQLKLIDETLK